MPASLQLLECVLDDVFGGRNITDHNHRQADKSEMMFREQRRHRTAGVRASSH
jgi:hypothetical protein